MPTEEVFPKSAKEMLPAAQLFMYEQFAIEILNIEEKLEYWQIICHSTGEAEKIQRYYEEIALLEARLRKMYEVAEWLGLDRKILDEIQQEEMLEQIERQAL